MKKLFYLAAVIVTVTACHESEQYSDQMDNNNKEINHNAPALRIAHITDPHLWDAQSKHVEPPRDDEGCLNFQHAKRVIKRINQEHDTNPIDMIVVSGDIGVEKLIEEAGIECKSAKISKDAHGNLLIDGENKDKEIEPYLKKGAANFAEVIATSKITTWLFVNGNNDLCAEDTRTAVFFNRFLVAVNDELKRLNSPVTAQDLIGDGDFVGVYEHKPSGQVFIGFENGSWKNNHDPEYALNINKEFQYKTVRTLEKEIKKYERQGKTIHLLFHAPGFDDPYNAALAQKACEKRIATNVQFNHDCTEATPKIAGNQRKNLNSAWLVEDSLRKKFDTLAAKKNIGVMFAGHFHSQKRSDYTSLQSWQTESYNNISKYIVAPPISIKNQSVDDKSTQARGFVIVNIKQGKKADATIFWLDQITNGACNEVEFSQFSVENISAN